MTVRVLAPLPLVFLLAGGCVTTGTYNAKVAEFDQFKQSAAANEKALKERREKDLAACEERRQAAEKAIGDELAKAQQQRDGLRKDYDESTALVGELKGRLEKLGQNVDKLTSERGQLADSLTDAKTRLEELRKQKAAAEERARTFNNLVQKLRAMIDAGQLKVAIRDGRMLIQLPNDVLFDSGKTQVKPDGQAALAKVAQILAGIPDRKFLVAGHTDDVPIKTARFPSNWDLSAARAVEVTTFLIQNGMRPTTVAAAGHGEFDPLVANDTPEHRAQNRRIEIVLQPNLSDLPSLDDVKLPEGK